MKLSVGMYVRTKYGHIAKLIYIDYEDEYYEFDKGIVWFYEYYKDMFGFKDEDLKQIIKTSFNIIDLIKPKDIILGRDGRLYQCWKIYKDYVFTYSKNKQGQTITLVDYQIDKVLTKEQFEQMSYKIGAEDDTN